MQSFFAWLFLTLAVVYAISAILALLNSPLVVGRIGRTRGKAFRTALVMMILCGVAGIAGMPRESAEEHAVREAARAAQDKKAATEFAYIRICQEAFRSKANYPSTVRFSVFDMQRGTAWAGKRFLYRAGPYAKNTFGLELRYVLRCDVEEGRIVRFDVAEAG